MRYRFLLLLALLSGTVTYAADSLSVHTFRYSGPFMLSHPFEIDSVGTDGKAFDSSAFLDTFVSFDSLENGLEVTSIPSCKGDALHLLGFSLTCSGFVKAELEAEGFGEHKLFVDGAELKGKEVKLEPGTHEFVFKCLSLSGNSPDTRPEAVFTNVSGSGFALASDGSRIYSLDVNTQGESCSGVSISAGGNCMAITHSIVSAGGAKTRYTDIISLPDGKIVGRCEDGVKWMPEGDSHYFTRPSSDGLELVSSNPLTGEQKVLAHNIPEGDFDIVPGGRYLIYTNKTEGPAEGAVHEILVPDDRQPGWRDRYWLSRYDMWKGVMQPLTFGYNNSWLADISADGKKILVMSSRSRLSSRPTTLSSLYVMDIESMSVKKVVSDDGFIAGASFSPAADRILVTGSPEAFGGAGSVVPEGRIPNAYDYQLFMVNVSDGKVTPLTTGFDPCVQKALWSRYDGNIYLSAEVGDCVKLFRYNVSSCTFYPLGDKEDNERHFDIASSSARLVYSGQGLEGGDRVYSMDLWKSRQSLICDFGAGRLKNVKLGKGGSYEFTNSRGDRINGFYVLPPDFDPSRKYPMIVHYYGGCSPTSRYTVGSYSPQYYAAQGYVFYVINPSGATGFGQEFASRHVNTAGDMVSDDIIEGTRKFCDEHPFVDRNHVGCFSASYGGFMTQLLLTKTDIYATGISHAGISDHTSYWGEGYWGYSYSEVSMAGSYPWTRKDLYVDRSPLYNADKIDTPLLFLHGSADTNVPIGESIQMFTALKLLGRETAFVVVDGENHGIMDYEKRRQWLRTISAWFSKYLKEDSSWWDELYPPKTL